MSLNYFI